MLDTETLSTILLVLVLGLGAGSRQAKENGEASQDPVELGHNCLLIPVVWDNNGVARYRIGRSHLLSQTSDESVGKQRLHQVRWEGGHFPR
jgi:hypothetical protein